LRDLAGVNILAPVPQQNSLAKRKSAFFKGDAMMRPRLIRQPGTKKFLDQYGDRLVCVRYRYDSEHSKRFTTVEIIVEESEWSSPQTAIVLPTVVGLRVALDEVKLQRLIKQAGGKWNREQRVWEIDYDQAKALGLENRIRLDEVSNTRHLPVGHN